MTAITAILLNSVRQLRSKNLFWLVLAISTLIFLAYGSIGFTPNGLSIGYGIWEFENEFLREDTVYARIFLEGIFLTVIVPLWFTWGAIILALISTADIFPDFIAKGAIDLSVSKPTGRVTMFFTKYIGALMFVLAQIGIFTVGVFLVLGLRLDEWRWPILLAIPIVILVYSYLYAIMVLVNIITKSALTSILITLIAWLGLFALQTTEGTLNQIRLSRSLEVQQIEERIDRLDRMATLAETRSDRARQAREWRAEEERLEASLVDAIASRDNMTEWHSRFRTVMNVLPKPQETVGILDRVLAAGDDDANGEGQQADFSIAMRALIENEVPEAEDERLRREAEFEALSEEEQLERADEFLADSPPRRRGGPPSDGTLEAIQEDYRERSAAFIIGTSLAFEFVILMIAAWIFRRRDF